jgi:hypothetical protein
MLVGLVAKNAILVGMLPVALAKGGELFGHEILIFVVPLPPIIISTDATIDVRKEFGKGRVKVHAEFDGKPYDGSIVNMGIKNEDGSICYIIGLIKDIRKKINRQAGDKIRVTIKERE